MFNISITPTQGAVGSKGSNLIKNNTSLVLLPANSGHWAVTRAGHSLTHCSWPCSPPRTPHAAAPGEPHKASGWEGTSKITSFQPGVHSLGPLMQARTGVSRMRLQLHSHLQSPFPTPSPYHPHPHPSPQLHSRPHPPGRTPGTRTPQGRPFWAVPLPPERRRARLTLMPSSSR